MSRENSFSELVSSHRSIRKYKKEPVTEKKIIEMVGKAQHAAFAGQMYSVIYETGKGLPFGAPLLFTLLVDLHKFSRIMEKRNWEWITNDTFSFILGIQDGSYFAQNLVLTAESMGMGTCFLGYTPYAASALKKKFKLPDKVFPFVQLAVGYPDEVPPVRPRYPMGFTLFKDKYPKLSDDDITGAMKVMDDGYLEEGYYKKLNAKIKLEGKRKETFDFSTYSWTEHISRKWGQWNPEKDKIRNNLEKCEFDL